MTFQYKHIQSPLGLILIAAHEEGLTGLWFDEHGRPAETKPDSTIFTHSLSF